MVLESLKIMIVDDDPDDAFITTRCIKKGLQSASLKIDRAGSFSELEGYLEMARYDLFFIDYHLGEFTGLEVMQKIRARGIQSPIILLTGQGDEMIAVAALKAGASDYLQKDKLTPEILSNSIRYSMDRFQIEALRRKTEKALRRSEEKYRTIIDTTTEGYWMFDTDLRTVDLNASLCRMLGYLREEILSLKPDELIEVKKRISFRGAMESLLLTDHKVFETVLKTKEGEALHAIFNATTIRSRKGKLRQVFAFVTDISQQKEAEAALQKANAALQKIDQMKSDFVSNVSHELRTPLTSIKNAIAILVKGKAGPFNETQERFLKMAARNIDRLAALVNDVLDYSKLESGQMEIRPSELQLKSLFENMESLFQAQAKEKEIQFEVNVMPMSPVYADADRVEQVLCNFLSNALKFTPEGGRVFLSSLQDGEWVRTSVSDSGPGLSAEDQVHVFDRFYQVGDSLGQTIQGTGLGLPIAKSLVEMQGGEIGVESQAGEGCRFFFTLPLFSQRAVEMAALEKIIQNLKQSPTFSLILVALHSEKSLEGDTSDTEIMKDTSDFLRKALPRDADIIIAQPSLSRIVCLLPMTSKANAATVKERLEKSLSLHSVFVKGGQIAVPDIMGPVSYPTDGETGKELIERTTSTGFKERKAYEQSKNSHCG